jgi:hypothetical protein
LLLEPLGISAAEATAEGVAAADEAMVLSEGVDAAASTDEGSAINAA